MKRSYARMMFGNHGKRPRVAPLTVQAPVVRILSLSDAWVKVQVIVFG